MVHVGLVLSVASVSSQVRLDAARSDPECCWSHRVELGSIRRLTVKSLAVKGSTELLTRRVSQNILQHR